MEEFYDNGTGPDIDITKKGPHLFQVDFGHFEDKKKILKFESVLAATMCEGAEHKKAFHLTKENEKHVDIHVNCGSYTENDILDIYNNVEKLPWAALRRLQMGAAVLGSGLAGAEIAKYLKERNQDDLENVPAVITASGATTAALASPVASPAESPEAVLDDLPVIHDSPAASPAVSPVPSLAASPNEFYTPESSVSPVTSPVTSPVASPILDDRS